MAVVTKYAKGFKDPNSVALPEPVFAEGRSRVVVTGDVGITSGDSIGSKHYLGRVPSNAIILPGSTLYHGAAGTSVTYDIGVELDGTVISANALASALAIATAGNKAVTAALATGSQGKRLWEVLGLTKDPGVTYDIVGKIGGAAATGTVSLEAFIEYVRK